MNELYTKRYPIAFQFFADPKRKLEGRMVATNPSIGSKSEGLVAFSFSVAQILI